MARVQNSIKNISLSLMSQAVTTVLSFALRTMIIQTVGIESAALKTLFHEIVSVLALSELGVGTAITFNLFKPLKDGNYVKIRELMNFYKTAYRFIAAAILILGTCVCVLIPYLIRDLPFDTRYIQMIFMLFVAQSAVSYLFSYKATLLHCDQKRYISTRITTVIKTVGTVVLLAILYYTRSFLLYILGEIAITIIVNVIVSAKVDYMYPYIKGTEKLPKEDQKKLFENIKDLFYQSLAGKIVGSTDNMLISALVSTVVVGYYGNYSTVVWVFRSVIDSATGGIDASVGNLYASETAEKCAQVMQRLTYGYFAAATVFVSGIFCCIQPFISMWVGSQYLLDGWTVFTVCIVFLVYVLSRPIFTAMYYTGLFDIGRNISIVAAIINLVVSVVLGYFIGISGIFIGTICVYVFEITAKSFYLYFHHLRISVKPYALRMFLYVSAGIAIMVLCKMITGFIRINSHLGTFFVNGVVSVLITICIIVLTTYRTEDFQYYWNMMRKMLRI